MSIFRRERPVKLSADPKTTPLKEPDEGLSLDLADFFQRKFSMDDYGLDLRATFVARLQFPDGRKMTREENVHLSEVLHEVLAWLTEIYTFAFNRAFVYFNRVPDQLPKILLERLDSQTTGMYDYEYNHHSLRMQDVLSYILECFNEETPEIRRSSRMSLEKTTCEEAFHFVQLLDPKTRAEVESDFEKYKDLTPEEYRIIHDSLWYEKQAELFTATVLYERLVSLITPGSEMFEPSLSEKERKYIKIAIEGKKAIIESASQSYPVSAPPVQSSSL